MFKVEEHGVATESNVSLRSKNSPARLENLGHHYMYSVNRAETVDLQGRNPNWCVEIGNIEQTEVLEDKVV